MCKIMFISQGGEIKVTASVLIAEPLLSQTNFEWTSAITVRKKVSMPFQNS